MPEVVERCVKKLMADPDFKPRKKGQTKKDAAWAVCTAAQKKKKLTHSNFDQDMVEVFAGAQVETFAQELFDDITTVAETLNARIAMDNIWQLVSALESSIDSIMRDEDIKDKRAEILKRLNEFKKLATKKLKEIGKFESDDELEIITFSEKSDYKVVENEDGTVTIKELPIFELGTHRGIEYDESWAKDVAIASHNKLKKESDYLPPVFIGHEDKEGEEKPKVAFFDNLKLKGKKLIADIINLPEKFAKDFPYRSVEINKKTKEVTGLALLGATPPHFKFKPIMFQSKEGEDEKIYLIFKDKNINPEGGDKMPDTLILTEENKNFFAELFKPITDLVKRKKEDKKDPDKDVFKKEDVDKIKDEVKKETEKEIRIKFAKDEKKKDFEELKKVLFKVEDDKEQKGKVYAPAIRKRIESLFVDADNHTTIKFSENDKEVQTTRYALLKSVFSEILKDEAIVELEEKTVFTEQKPPDGKGKFTDKEAKETAEFALKTVNPPKKKKEE